MAVGLGNDGFCSLLYPLPPSLTLYLLERVFFFVYFFCYGIDFGWILIMVAVEVGFSCGGGNYF